MPELPEVEVMRRDLQRLVEAQPKIEKIEFLRRDLRDPMPIKALKKLEGAKILGVRRRAKYLLIETSAGGILSHLGMTGTWRQAPVGEERDHDHIYLYLSSGIRLAYRDPRRFGIFETYDVQRQSSSPRLKNLGPEPFDAEFSADYLRDFLRGKKATVKALLMDQRCVVGVGNIYASEALFKAQVSPLKKANSVKLEQCQKIVRAIQETLKTAIDEGGSSISDFVHSNGESGNYQNSHQVYDRKGEKCFVCGTLIRAKVLAGRSTYWCPACQK